MRFKSTTLYQFTRNILKYITDGSKKHSVGLYTHINRVNKLLSWGIVICLNFLGGMPDFLS